MKVYADRQILYTIWQKKCWWIGHSLKDDGQLTTWNNQGRMTSKPTRKEKSANATWSVKDGGLAMYQTAPHTIDVNFKLVKNTSDYLW